MITTRKVRYVIVSPVRDEEEYIALTIESVIRQTVLPEEWVIVNDGSRDATGKIIDEYGSRYCWIKTLHQPDRGRRVPGSGVMEAFYKGYRSVKSTDWEFIIKLDGDVGLQPNYLEQCFKRFDQDPMLGMAGGLMYRIQGGKLQPELHPIFQVRGPIKLYRRACWEAIGGLIQKPGWDTVDEVQANRLGWRTRTFQELQVIHYRPTGAVQGTWRNGLKNGQADYISGYHPVFMIAKCLKRLFQKPYLINAVANACGFLSGYANRIERVNDQALIRYVRSQQLRRLLFKESIWR